MGASSRPVRRKAMWKLSPRHRVLLEFDFSGKPPQPSPTAQAPWTLLFPACAPWRRIDFHTGGDMVAG